MPNDTSPKAKVLFDPYPRKLDEIFALADLARLHDIADVIWGRYEPMPAQEVTRIKGDLFAILADNWRHGSLDDAPQLRALIELGGSPHVPMFWTMKPVSGGEFVSSVAHRPSVTWSPSKRWA